MANLTVGVSGASSSGKTTLTLMLYEIFHNNGCKVFLVHEDNYFALKESCPMTKFKHDVKGVDVLGVDCDCWNSLELDPMISSIKYIKQTGKDISADKWNSSEANDRSVFSENIADLDIHLGLIAEMQAKVKDWIQAHSNTGPEEGGLNIASASANSNKPEGSKWLQPAICLVDGFLLYTDSAAPSLRNAITEEQPHRPQYSIRTSSLPAKDVLAPPTPFGHEYNDSVSSAAPSINGESCIIPIGLVVPRSQLGNFNPANTLPSANPNLTTQSAKLTLNGLIDLKLFIPVTKQTVMARRFSRTPYMDPPQGTRKPTEHWKTKGYYEDVVWKNYAKEHDWLFSGDVEKIPFSLNMRHKGGVRMPLQLDANIETLINWAVEAILHEMGRNIDVELAAANFVRHSQHNHDEGRYKSGNSRGIDTNVPPQVFMSRVQDVVEDEGSTADVSDLETIMEEEEEYTEGYNHTEENDHIQGDDHIKGVETADHKKGGQGSIFRNFANKFRAKIAERREKWLAKKKERTDDKGRLWGRENDFPVNDSRTGFWNMTVLGTPLTPLINAWRTRGSGNGFDGGSPVHLRRGTGPVDLDA